MKHLNDQLILHYLAETADEDEQDEVEEHLMACEDCFRRAQTLRHMRENFDRLWDSWTPQEHGRVYRLSQGSIAAAAVAAAAVPTLPECVIELKAGNFERIVLSGKTTLIGIEQVNIVDKWRVRNERYPKIPGIPMGPYALLGAEARPSKPIRMNLEFTRMVAGGSLTLLFQIQEDNEVVLRFTLDCPDRGKGTPTIEVMIDLPGLETICDTVVAGTSTNAHSLGKVSDAGDKSVRVRVAVGEQTLEDSMFTIRS